MRVTISVTGSLRKETHSRQGNYHLNEQGQLQVGSPHYEEMSPARSESPLLFSFYSESSTFDLESSYESEEAMPRLEKVSFCSDGGETDFDSDKSFCDSPVPGKTPTLDLVRIESSKLKFATQVTELVRNIQNFSANKELVYNGSFVIIRESIGIKEILLNNAIKSIADIDGVIACLSECMPKDARYRVVPALSLT